MTELAMPSQVMDKKLIQMPEGNVVDSDEEWDRCGKWMLHHSQGDLGFLDSAWTVLQHLLHDGTLVMLKASTGLVADAGVSIYCFTRPGKLEAKRAATAIRMLVDFKGIMYYKLNKQPSQGSANRYGDRRASIYMQTLRGGFYTKENGAWIQDNEDAIENLVPIASKFLKENYSGNEGQPSNYKRCFWNSPKNHQCEQTACANWYMFCSCEEEAAHLTEVDRVWLVAKQLLEEGLFVGLTLIKTENAKCAEVRFYVSQDCNVYSRLTSCDRIFKEASCKTVIMYFAEAASRICNNPERHKTLGYDYKYISNGELYILNKMAEEYIFV